MTVTLGIEASRSVPAGSFSNVLRARTELSFVFRVPALGIDETVTSALTFWYAPGVGPIRREYVDPNFAAPNNVASEELSGVSLAVLKAGTMPGFVALDAIGAGSSSDEAGIPAMASDGQNVFVVSRSAGATGEPASLVGALLRPDGSVLATRTLVEPTTGSYLQLRSTAAFDGQNFRAFWTRPDKVLVGQRLSSAGDLLDPAAGAPVPNVPNAGTDSIGSVAAASNGSSVLLVWQRLDQSLPVPGWVTEGQVLDRTGAAVSPVFGLGAGEGTLDVAWSSGYYLVTQAASGNLFIARIDAAGTPMGPGGWELLATGGSAYKSDARVVAHPDGFLVGWMAWDASPNAGIPNRILSRRVNAEGVPLDASDVAIDPSATTGRSSFALASGSEGLLGAWVKDLTLNPMESADSVRATRAPWLTGAPAFGDAAPFWYTAPSATPPYLAYPAAVSAGDRFVTAWLENVQTSGAVSDRIVTTFTYPPANR